MSKNYFEGTLELQLFIEKKKIYLKNQKMLKYLLKTSEAPIS